MKITTQYLNNYNTDKYSLTKKSFNQRLSFGNSNQEHDEFIKRLHKTDDDENTIILKGLLNYRQGEGEALLNAGLPYALAVSFGSSEYYY